MAVLDNVELALAQRVPELDRSVPGGRDNLTVVGGEGDAGVGQRSFQLDHRDPLPSNARSSSVQSRCLYVPPQTRSEM